VGGHSEADGLLDVAQPASALVLGGEALTLDLLLGLAPNSVGRPFGWDGLVVAQVRLDLGLSRAYITFRQAGLLG
jgi:hypothetical protein